jgi:dTMP kinase
MEKQQKGKFIVFEGGDYSGKTTQVARFCKYLELRGFDFVQTLEPGGTELGEWVRPVVKGQSGIKYICPNAELLLFEVSRAQHVPEVIVPALKQGKLVVSDRFEASTLAYQLFGRQLLGSVISHDQFKVINSFATNGLIPDLTIWLDLDPIKAAERKFARKPEGDTFDQQDIDFYNRVREGFKYYFEHFKGKFIKIDAGRSMDWVHNQILMQTAEIL